jgi:ketosteroid isomerase-like protein
MHPNEDLLRREYDAFAREDLTSLDEIFADGIVYHVPGHNPLSGDFHGARQGRVLEDITVHVVHVVDGKITEAWFFPGDQAASDAFWS